ncbi:hypothetical protein [Streptomyces griseocarneus]|uniref:hypothetical protein n=1 Tax=Streptomyces griseocarneus TaxID=51201 RepID=UPI00167EC068|nr:hypothetical protein [Streptomyces griseocarneus]MBZ6473355.1 hypothetical protein [Streptomyces griseocarneus]GHG57384.1 hypothetical protein GCM10018779_22400 [Streptomyces griseocarneus]
MSTAGTIDRPTTYDPTKQAPIMRHPSEPFGSHTPRHTSATESRQNRNLEMQLIPEALARAHMQELRREAESQRTAVRLVAARRMQRRAERASLRARRALAMAVMQ